MSKQEHGRQHCPPGSVAAGQPPPVMKEPLSGVRRLSPLPGGTHKAGNVWVWDKNTVRVYLVNFYLCLFCVYICGTACLSVCLGGRGGASSAALPEL